MDLVGKRHGDGEGGEQDAACHKGNGDPSANHGQTFLKVVVGFGATFNQHAIRARERYRHAFQRERLGISLPPVFCRLKIAQEDEDPVSPRQALAKSELFRGSIVANRALSSETVTAGPR